MAGAQALVGADPHRDRVGSGIRRFAPGLPELEVHVGPVAGLGLALGDWPEADAPGRMGGVGGGLGELDLDCHGGDVQGCVPGRLPRDADDLAPVRQVGGVDRQQADGVPQGSRTIADTRRAAS